MTTQIVLNTPFGPLVVHWNAAGLVSIAFGAFASGGRSRAFAAPRVEDPIARAFVHDLERYFAGEKVVLDPPLALGAPSTPFQRQVWEATRQVPYAQIRTYGWLANRINRPKAARSVGAALGLNPVPLVVPCHRIVTTDGRLGGFSDGADWKRALLELEGVSGIANP